MFKLLRLVLLGDLFTDCTTGKSPLCSTIWGNFFGMLFHGKSNANPLKDIAVLYRAFVVRDDGGLHNPLRRPCMKDNGGFHIIFP